ncbi:MAG: L-glutamate gamma-semialdehyde dehydrogenase [Deltaproteobacteria bacterium]|nr:L-glutamate gamma-semialdehyde dehydrogenase [Deltaproteobacteria bacterium]
MEGLFETTKPSNEPVKSYAPGTPERAELKKRLAEMSGTQIEIPIIIGGKEVKTGKMGECRMPHKHSHLLGTFHKASAEQVEQAIAAAREARKDWANRPWQERAAVFLRAADLLAGPYRQTLNAATMLAQSKTAHQAEIDAACELIDFFRFNVYYMQKVYSEQPDSGAGIWNMLDHRPLEGFVFAVTPFNFASIAGNLPTAPALMGCTVVWKPASTAVYTAHYIMELLEAAGLPPGVINMVPGTGGQVGKPALTHPELAGIHFTGSTATFQSMWRTVGENIANYHAYPRIVGETGGKDFVVVHPSAEPKSVATALVRGAFEYQGQKCSAASRAYVPKSLWQDVKDFMAADMAEIKMGDPADFSNFMTAVIDKAAFNTITSYIDHAKQASDAEVVLGGEYDDSEGYFVKPTVIQAKDPKYRSMQEEIFGPVLTVYVYEDADYEKALDLCNETSPYALTGAIFARERKAIHLATSKLRDAAGNFYINDKPTGAVVGQQPFGGARASGTNDKAGSFLNLIRWISPRTIKETFVPATDFRYPFMAE